MLMQYLAINRTGNYRKATLNGKEHYVVPVAMIVPGVLPGSKGKLFYPSEEIAKNYDAWNGMPLVVNHPMVNGRPVSARSATILESHGIGVVLNAKINSNHKLVAEGWFDIEKTNLIEPRIISAIERGEQIELSTGLFTENIPVKNAQAAVYNGKQYTHVAKNYRPDHLAILMDELGACSIKDGCGVGVLNSSKKKKNDRCWEGYKPTKGKKPYAEGSCEPLGNATSMRKDAGKFLPKKEKCTGCGKLKTKCECEPVENLSSGEETTVNELSYSELYPNLEKNLSAKFPGAYVQEVYRDYVIFRYASTLYQMGYSVDKKTDLISLDSEMPTPVRKVTTYKTVDPANVVFNSSDPLAGLSDTTKAQLILNGGRGSGRKKGSKNKNQSSVRDLTSKTGKPLDIKEVVSAFQGVKQGQSVSFTKHGPLGDNNVTEGTVVARYGFNKGFHLKGVGAIDVKTQSGEIKRVSALTQFHRIASVDQGDYTKNVFSDEARAAALLARKKMGEAGTAVKDAGKKAIVSGVKAAGGAAKAGLKRTGQAYKEVALHLLDKIKQKLGMGTARGTKKSSKSASKTVAKGEKKPMKKAKDQTERKAMAKQRSKDRLAKIESRLKAHRDKKTAKKEATAKRIALKKTVQKNKAGIKSKQRREKLPVTEPKAKSKASSKTVSKGSNKKLASAKSKGSGVVKDFKARKPTSKADLAAQKNKNAGLRAKLEAGKASNAKSKEKLMLARKINKVNTATRKKEKAWGLE